MTKQAAALRVLLLAAFLCSALDSQAFQKAAVAPLPQIDLRENAAAGQQAPDRQAAVARLHQLQPTAKASFDPWLGSPRVVASTESFLTGKNGSGRAVSAGVAAGFAGDRHAATKAFLEEHRDLFGHGAEALQTARIKREDVSAHNGLHSTVWEQQVDGIGVFEALLVSHTTRDGELVTLSSRLLAKPSDAANSGAPANALRNTAGLSAAESLRIAVESVGDKVALGQVSALAVPSGDPERHQTFRAPALKGDAYTRLTWFPVTPKSLRLCWEVIFESASRREMFLALIDARDGTVLLRRNLTRHASTASFRVFTGESPNPMSPGYSSPNSIQPPTVSRQLVTLTALDTNASPAGWIPDGVNETRGNNVDAYLDRNANDQPDLPRPQGSPNRVFDFPLDLTLDPTMYGNASVVQLFYICNWYHDKLYELGFTEAAGNFQADNLGRGGIAGDPVDAEAQDGSDLNNSDFSPTPDGLPPRMQMYIFSGPNPRRDAVFDSEIVLHEYTHGLSDRLVGGGAGLTADQSGGLSEGWSDFYAMAILTGSEDNVDACYPMAPYATYLLDGETQNYYYGIRRYPYTTDMTRNPLTFKDIDPSQESPHLGVPMSPVFSFNPAYATEVHNAGEVWCVTLWELRASLIKRYGWAVGNHLALQLVTDGMKLSPPNPNFLEARDGIILADRVNNDGANYRTLWAAFAKRGMGFHAYSPDSTSTAGLVESFDEADDLAVTTDSETSTGPVGGPFTILVHEWSLVDTTSNAVPWTAGASAPWLTLSQCSGALLPADPPLTVAARLNLQALQLKAGIYTNLIVFTNVASGVTQTRRFVLYVGQPDYFCEAFQSGSNDLSGLSFTFTPDNSLSAYNVCRTEITSYPTDPTGGTVLAMKDDNFVRVVLSTSHRPMLYGTSSSIIYVGSNGYITFGSGDSSNDQSFQNFFSRMRIAPLMSDLDPGTNGTVSWKELSDRVAVTWDKVPEYGLGNTNCFQVEMFYDGRIRFSYLQMDALHGDVGLSSGTGVASNFSPSDFSKYRRCDDSAAWLTVSLPASVIEGVGTLAGQGTVSLSGSLSFDLTIALDSSDPASVSVPASVSIPAGSTSTTFDVTVLDNTVLDGSRTVVITPSASGLAAMPGSMVVLDDEYPTLSVTLPSAAGAGSAVQGLVNVTPTPASNVGVKLSVSGSGSAGAQVPAWIAVPAGQTSAVFTLQLGNAPTSNLSSVVVTAHASGAADATASVQVIYNQSTNLFVSLPSKAIAGNGTLTNYGWLSLSNLLVADLVVPLASSSTNVLVPSSVTIPAGHKGAPFNITIADHLQAAETALVTEGLTGASNSMFVQDEQTPLAPSSPMPWDGSATNSCLVALTWSPGLGEGSELIVNGNFETGDFTGWTLPASTNGSFAVDDGTLRSASGDALVAPYAGGACVLGQKTGTGAFQMSQDAALPADATVIALAWADRLRNFAGVAQSNQQLRVELRTTNNVILSTVFASTNGGASDWVSRAFDISAFKGQTVRICFVVTAALAPLDVYLDNISVRAANPAVTSYDVYLGTNATLGAAQFLGTTTNTSWGPITLPVHAQNWQIIARRTGTAASPVWHFSTVPTVFLNNTEVVEGPAGTTTNAVFLVSLSAPSVQTIGISYATVDGTANAGTDYVGVATGTLVFKPGETNKSITVVVNGDNTPETDETFWLKIASITNAPMATDRAVCVIRNDDPWPGVVDHFVWNAVPSPQGAGDPFLIGVAAYDVFNNPVTNLASLSLRGIELGATSVILGNRIPTGTDSFSTYTLGYIFTPATNITITHARHFYGTKVSIWNDSKALVASVSVKSVAGTWVETAFPVPVQLSAGKSYYVGVYTAGQTYAWVSDTWPRPFADGSIQQPCYSSVDACPTNAASRGLYLVDLRYTVGTPVAIDLTPAVVSNIVGGAWSGAVTVPVVGTNLELVADDGAGHQGFSSPFNTIAVGPRTLAAAFSTNGFVISWPGPTSTYVLETTESLSPANWVPVPMAPVQLGNMLMVTNPPAQGERYFRLRR